MKRELLEEIIHGIEETGSYEVSIEALETVVGQGDRRSPHSRDQILAWAEENSLQYEYIDKGNTEVIRFYREK